MELVLNINNKNVTVNVPTDEMLLDTLRNLGYYSVRCGCDLSLIHISEPTRRS